MVGGQRHAPAALLPGKGSDTHSAQQETVQKISLPLGCNSWTVHPVASFYTDWAIPAHQYGLLIEVTVLMYREELVPLIQRLAINKDSLPDPSTSYRHATRKFRIQAIIFPRSWASSVSIVIRPWASSLHPKIQLHYWGPPRSIANGSSLLENKEARTWYCCLTPSIADHTICGTMPSLPQMPSRSGTSWSRSTITRLLFFLTFFGVRKGLFPRVFPTTCCPEKWPEIYK